MATHSVIVLRLYVWQKFQEKYWQCKYMGHTRSNKQINFTIKNRYEYENATHRICALYSLLYKIPTLIKAFLSPFWKYGDPLPSELCFSSSWTTTHGFLDFHICHNLLASDLIFYKPEQMVVKEIWVQTVCGWVQGCQLFFWILSMHGELCGAVHCHVAEYLSHSAWQSF